MRKFLLAAVAAALIPGAANAAAFTNGSFETGPTPGNFLTLNAGSTAITGWTVGGAGIDYIGTRWKAQDGARSIDLSALDAGSLTQTFDTIAGQAYRVSFALATNPEGDRAIKNTVVSAIGGVPQTIAVAVGSSTTANMGWQTYSYDFTAAGTSTSLSFTSQTNTWWGPALDNVSVTAVPEPATWLSMIVGFGLLGGVMRRRVTTLATA